MSGGDWLKMWWNWIVMKMTNKSKTPGRRGELTQKVISKMNRNLKLCWCWYRMKNENENLWNCVGLLLSQSENRRSLWWKFKCQNKTQHGRLISVALMSKLNLWLLHAGIIPDYRLTDYHLNWFRCTRLHHLTPQRQRLHNETNKLWWKRKCLMLANDDWDSNLNWLLNK